MLYKNVSVNNRLSTKIRVLVLYVMAIGAENKNKVSHDIRYARSLHNRVIV